MLLKLVSIFLLSISISASWKKPISADTFLNINELQFKNRSSCAKESKRPTASAFVILNNIDIGKGMYRLAKFTGQNPKVIVTEGIIQYRLSVIELIKLIHHKLINRELPLLKSSLEDKNIPSRYREIMESCNTLDYCYELDDYLSDVWKVSQQDDRDNKFQEIDSFDKYNFLPNKVFNKKELKKSGTPDLSCHTLKKFGPLQAHLYGTKPDTETFNKIANTILNKDEYLSDCSDVNTKGDIKSVAFQLDIRHLKNNSFLKKHTWKNYGFDYWNSLKIYFSWAWRNAPEVKPMAGHYYDLFKSVAIEDSLFFISNGCGSLTNPTCNSDFLNLQSIKEFAKQSYVREATELDIMSDVVKGPATTILDDVFTEVNTDILDLKDSKTAGDWVNRFRNNLTNTRLIYKRKLLQGLTFFNVLTETKHPDSIKHEVSHAFLKASRAGNDSIQLQRLYALCSEFNYAHHPEFGFLIDKLSILKDEKSIDVLGANFSKGKISKFYDLYKNIADIVINECSTVDQRKVWNDDFKYKKESYNKWYISEVLKSEIESNSYENVKSLWENDKTSFLNWKKDDSFEGVVCYDGIHCARQTLKTILDLYNVATYSQSLWSFNQEVKAPSMFNPYAERTACKVYDPWYRTKSVIFNLVTDLAQAALVNLNRGVVYTRFDLEPGKVTSFRQLVKDGKIEYSADYTPQRIRTALITDFGPLLGVPCSISLSGKRELNYGTYRFGGVSVRSCLENERNILTVNNASDPGQTDSSSVNGCVACSLDFESVATSVTKFSPLGSVYYGVRALFRFIGGISDKNNFPRSWETDLNKVAATARAYGEIPKKCVRKLRRGEVCLPDKCSESVFDEIQGLFKSSVTNMDRVGNRIALKVAGCEEVIEFNTRRKDRDMRNNLDQCQLSSRVKIPASCRRLLK